MKRNCSSGKQVALSIAAFTAITTATAAQTQEPLVIEEQGSFFVNEELLPRITREATRKTHRATSSLVTCTFSIRFRQTRDPTSCPWL